MAVLKRKPKKANLSELAVGNKQVSPTVLLEQAVSSGIQTIPLDVERLVSSLGIKLRSLPLDDDISGHLALTERGWEITVNSLHHPKRQRFTVAHELGHYMLHRRQCQEFTDNKLFRGVDQNPMETEANVYAADLIMPEDAFRSFINNVSNKIDAIAEHFGVSALAVRVRAKTLGFKGHGL